MRKIDFKSVFIGMLLLLLMGQTDSKGGINFRRTDVNISDKEYIDDINKITKNNNSQNYLNFNEKNIGRFQAIVIHDLNTNLTPKNPYSHGISKTFYLFDTATGDYYVQGRPSKVHNVGNPNQIHWMLKSNTIL